MSILSKEEILKKLSELDNLELMEDLQDSWNETNSISEETYNNLQKEKESLQKDYDDLKTKYKERFFEKVDNKIEPSNINTEGLHEEEILKVDNIFKEVEKYGKNFIN